MRVDPSEVLRFGVVGLAATLVHAMVLGAGLWAGLPAAFANVVAFGVAVWVSYCGQSWWVFRRPPRDMYRFAIVALVGLVLHAVGMPVLQLLGLGVWWAWLVLTVLVPGVGFFASRFWAFEASRAL